MILRSITTLVALFGSTSIANTIETSEANAPIAPEIQQIQGKYSTQVDPNELGMRAVSICHSMSNSDKRTVYLGNVAMTLDRAGAQESAAETVRSIENPIERSNLYIWLSYHDLKNRDYEGALTWIAGGLKTSEEILDIRENLRCKLASVYALGCAGHQDRALETLLRWFEQAAGSKYNEAAERQDHLRKILHIQLDLLAFDFAQQTMGVLQNTYNTDDDRSDLRSEFDTSWQLALARFGECEAALQMCPISLNNAHPLIDSTLSHNRPDLAEHILNDLTAKYEVEDLAFLKRSMLLSGRRDLSKVLSTAQVYKYLITIGSAYARIGNYDAAVRLANRANFPMFDTVNEEKEQRDLNQQLGLLPCIPTVYKYIYLDAIRRGDTEWEKKIALQYGTNTSKEDLVMALIEGNRNEEALATMNSIRSDTFLIRSHIAMARIARKAGDEEMCDQSLDYAKSLFLKSENTAYGYQSPFMETTTDNLGDNQFRSNQVQNKQESSTVEILLEELARAGKVSSAQSCFIHSICHVGVKEEKKVVSPTDPEWLSKSLLERQQEMIYRALLKNKSLQVTNPDMILQSARSLSANGLIDEVLDWLEGEGKSECVVRLCNTEPEASKEMRLLIYIGCALGVSQDDVDYKFDFNWRENTPPVLFKAVGF